VNSVDVDASKTRIYLCGQTNGGAGALTFFDYTTNSFGSAVTLDGACLAARVNPVTHDLAIGGSFTAASAGAPTGMNGVGVWSTSLASPGLVALQHNGVAAGCDGQLSSIAYRNDGGSATLFIGGQFEQ
jgi:hypothetical protein